ncbi:hypothetical protein F3K02_24765 [Hydrogenophaga sp. D2P1]|uniref:DUF998 domain-containing protein n=1 Tax=Hydrogenophaga aromaticivorans TaxID=2610898 RepID=A0A7Y8H0V3_9BURK|nr:hypothetical protein [Hydrogenophaga aromaticivorans]NWF48442.1 hypothetical protein [Hydrogenophaga aromaticivorans]
MDRTQPGLMNNQPPPADAQALWRHFSETYFSLRFGLAVLAFAFPAFLYFWGRFVHDLPLQPSMSAYFFAARASAETGAAQCAEFPMRTFFVGGLCAIAAGLHLYKGLTRRENTLLNTAAICALLVAVYPERITGKDLSGDDRVMQLVKDCPAVLDWAGRQPDLPIHFAAAAALFVLLGIVAWQCACHSLSYLPADHKHREPMFRRAYRVLAALMFLGPATGFVLAALLDRGGSVVFFVEMVGIWTFGAYWALKTWELSLSKLEKDPGAAVRNAAPDSPDPR